MHDAGETPAALIERPETPAHFEFVWRAFLDLVSTRQIGMGAGPIPWTGIDAWARRNGVEDPDQFETLSMIVQRLDAEHLRLIAPKKDA